MITRSHLAVSLWKVNAGSVARKWGKVRRAWRDLCTNDAPDDEAHVYLLGIELSESYFNHAYRQGYFLRNLTKPCPLTSKISDFFFEDSKPSKTSLNVKGPSAAK